jgi:CRP/FNR family nitrogen fixation transcriptional regulator
MLNQLNVQERAFDLPRASFAPSRVFAPRRLYDGALVSTFDPGEEVVGEGDAAENFYVVAKGVFRGVRFTGDGRRQVMAFYASGDMCGLESGAKHELTIEAVDEGSMAVLSRQACRARMRADPQFNMEMFGAATRSLSLAVEHSLMLCHSSADERLAWFLQTLLARSQGPAMRRPTLELVMSRQDIADYLGLTIETVSRTLTRFRERGLIKLLTTHRLEICEAKLLEELASADRDGFHRRRGSAAQANAS